MTIPKENYSVRFAYIQAQLARIDELLANTPQDELEDGWQGDSDVYQLSAERIYWETKLNQ